MSRRPLAAGNWKMNPTDYRDAIDLASSLADKIKDVPEVDVVLCPPYPWIFPVYEVLKKRSLLNVHLGGQNIHYEPKGAYTGEVSAPMLKGIAEYVIVGHSERIRYFKETSTMISKKISIALDLDNQLIPIICVGERARMTNAKAEVSQQLKRLIRGIPEHADFVVAYEPAWAISAAADSEPATGEYAQKVARGIREIIGDERRIIYGGSVTEENIADFMQQDDIDGALVGSASLSSEKFSKICSIAAKIKNQEQKS